MTDEELANQLQIIHESTTTLVEVIEDLRSLTSERLDSIEKEVRTGNRQLQQAVLLLAEIATEDEPG